jgi:hypothetical protein
MPGPAQVIGIREPEALALVQSLLEQGISVRIRVSGNSMRPLLQGNEAVEVVPLGRRLPQLGDILLLRGRQNTPLVHRLIWRRKRGGIWSLLTKGDACPGFDGFVAAECALGRVERILYGSSNGQAVCLRTPWLRLQALGIVGQTLLRHLLFRIAAD